MPEAGRLEREVGYALTLDTSHGETASGTAIFNQPADYSPEPTYLT